MAGSFGRLRSCIHKHIHASWIASEDIGLTEDVYERLKAHKRGDESYNETLDRILTDIESDWRTHAGFLTDDEAAALEAAVARGLSALDDLGDN